MNKALLFLFCLSASCPLWGMQKNYFAGDVERANTLDKGDLEREITLRFDEIFREQAQLRGYSSLEPFPIAFEYFGNDFCEHIDWLEDVISGEISLEETVTKLLDASKEYVDIDEFEIVLSPAT